MSYTPTTWTTGDTITAQKMNKLEQGVANAGGAACIRLSATDFNSTSRLFGFLVYAYLDNGSWIVECDADEYWEPIYGYNEPARRLVCKPLPSDENVGLFLVDEVDNIQTITGNISTTPTTLYFSYGSVVQGNNTAYRITGDGSYTFIAA